MLGKVSKPRFGDTGDVVLTGADCAEDFDVSGDESVESGTVVVIDEEGSLRASQHPYDKKVAGVKADLTLALWLATEACQQWQQ